MTQAEIPKSCLTEATFHITEKCNYACVHCSQGDAGTKEMSMADFSLAVGSVNNPFFTKFKTTGGEPRLLRWLPQFGSTIRQALAEKNGGLYTDEAPIIANVQEDKNAVRKALKSLSTRRVLGPDWQKGNKRERDTFLIRLKHDLGVWNNRQVLVEFDTNCHGMSDGASITNILTDLYKQGVGRIRFSLDEPHRQYTKSHHLPVDYALVYDLICADSQDRGMLELQTGIKANMQFVPVGCGEYVLPLGRAADFVWEERVRMAGVPTDDIAEKTQKIKRRLSQEYDNWKETLSFSHCYCGPATFYREAESVMAFLPENRLHFWSVTIGPALSASLCGHDGLPTLGNIRELSPDAVYQRALKSKLYEILGHEGPQGVARCITNWPEEKIKAKYIEMTPCGLCHFLKENYPDQLQNLLEQENSFGQQREQKSRKGIFTRLSSFLG